ncbi:MAG: asparagine synthetase B [Clostridiales bacterium]|nr:asparagine synthetase B [Clostridiales bacterium]
MGGIAQIYQLNEGLIRRNRGQLDISKRYSRQIKIELSRMRDNIQHRKPIKPISNENDSMRILFSGRLWNTSEIRKKLKRKHHFSSDLDGEAVLHLYEEVGEKCVHSLEGAYAFVVYPTKHEINVVEDAGKDVNGEANRIFIARDPLGVKPLYISEDDEKVCVASEFKALSEIAPDFQEFPIGSYYQAGDQAQVEDRFVRFHSFSAQEPITTFNDAKSGIQKLLTNAVRKRIDRSRPFGVYLSGGLDSSIIAALTAREWEGVDSFAVGVEGSEDLLHARMCAKHLGTKHHEYIYTLEEMLEVLPTVIYHLESYDAALVRSSVPNYFLARMAAEPDKVVLSGEGADELFCGYPYMKSLSEEERESEAFHLLETLHSTGLQRGDRMAAAFGMEARVPFLDLDLIQFALRIPDSMMYGPAGEEKWVLRKAFSHMLPREITGRKKKKFSIGAGSSDLMRRAAEERISDEEFTRHRETTAGHRLKSKEDLFYYRIFHEFYPQKAAEETVSFSRSL